ncbi:IS200/IS605 family transposase [Micromonospora sp. CPCC 206171]|uniref:IS200/IS605 family transposase n=1 Tax=Micromonospora sp. CPCC 206171 TaxID=3122405 RepID=UPI003FA60D8B
MVYGWVLERPHWQTLVFTLYAQLVFVTKFRHKVFGDRHLARLEQSCGRRAPTSRRPVEFNGEGEHVHLLVNFPPKVALSKLVNTLKGMSSRRIRHEFPDLVRHYDRANKRWSASYFAGSVGGAPLTVLRQYIEQQNRPG